MVSGKSPVLIVPVTHEALNSNHRTVFGGWMMAQMDIAASIPAIKRAQGPVVTKLAKAINFVNPGLAHDIFSFYAEITKTGTSSMHIEVDVWAERFENGQSSTVQIGTGQMVFVAIDTNGKPRKLPENTEQ